MTTIETTAPQPVVWSNILPICAAAALLLAVLLVLATGTDSSSGLPAFADIDESGQGASWNNNCAFWC